MKQKNKNKEICKEDLQISYRKTFKKYKPRSHYHDAYEIFLLASGKGKYFIKDRIYHLKDQSLCLIKNQEIHKCIFDENSCYVRYVIHIKPNYIKKIENSFFDFNYNKIKTIFDRKIKHFKLDDCEYNKLSKLIENTILEKNQKEYCFKDLICLNSIKLLIFIYRILDNNFSSESQKLDKSRIKQILDFLNNNYKENLKLNNIAKEFNISKCYLSRFFKEETGLNVIEYINNKRIKEAERLLENTNNKITDIAYKVGFNNLTHFERVFKKVTGLTPSQYKHIN